MQTVMQPDITDFYNSHEGAVCAALIRERLQWFWPDLRRQSVLGVGFAQPYLSAWRGRGALCVSAILPSQIMPMQDTAASDGFSVFSREDRCCVVDAQHLPFCDEMFDRVLVVHALENAEQAVTLLRAASRVLRDDGRILLIVPNKIGGRLRQKNTPFARDARFTRNGLKAVLGRAMLHMERRDEACFLPVLRGYSTLERGRASDIAGKVFCPGLGSLMLVEAVKDVHAALPLPVTAKRSWFRKSVVATQEF
ncbi:methyltransferase [Acetobacter indonesiensis NRIC 0313]|uniref:Methyltransferase n=2 Tax=Acetobacter indonesiensis TaxID=104101 RepID=A0A6N3T373_9PROT|nr:methyltransferase [Acetobacter indonesiensis]GBQ54592.1 methyltransferase [Acetobacter indonesiensis NRIC 0313]GEN02350.1 methyltransferase type 11 [Acetobacter indonesiensis]